MHSGRCPSRGPRRERRRERVTVSAALHTTPATSRRLSLRPCHSGPVTRALPVKRCHSGWHWTLSRECWHEAAVLPGILGKSHSPTGQVSTSDTGPHRSSGCAQDARISVFMTPSPTKDGGAMSTSARSSAHDRSTPHMPDESSPWHPEVPRRWHDALALRRDETTACPRSAVTSR